jgi:hypothetical protein
MKRGDKVVIPFDTDLAKLAAKMFEVAGRRFESSAHLATVTRLQWVSMHGRAEVAVSSQTSMADQPYPEWTKVNFGFNTYWIPPGFLEPYDPKSKTNGRELRSRRAKNEVVAGTTKEFEEC